MDLSWNKFQKRAINTTNYKTKQLSKQSSFSVVNLASPDLISFCC